MINPSGISILNHFSHLHLSRSPSYLPLFICRKPKGIDVATTLPSFIKGALSFLSEKEKELQPQVFTLSFRWEIAEDLMRMSLKKSSSFSIFDAFQVILLLFIFSFCFVHDFAIFTFPTNVPSSPSSKQSFY